MPAQKDENQLDLRHSWNPVFSRKNILRVKVTFISIPKR